MSESDEKADEFIRLNEQFVNQVAGNCTAPENPTKNKRYRKRSANISELTFKSMHSAPFEHIRIWENDRKMIFYDCDCGRRKPIQDLNKIKRHIQTHSIRKHKCDVCHRNFERYVQLNAHKKAHRYEVPFTEQVLFQD
jgi:hypothetical protein